jgi:hypothetical protein
MDAMDSQNELSSRRQAIIKGSTAFTGICLAGCSSSVSRISENSEEVPNTDSDKGTATESVLEAEVGKYKQNLSKLDRSGTGIFSYKELVDGSNPIVPASKADGASTSIHLPEQAFINAHLESDSKMINYYRGGGTGGMLVETTNLNSFNRREYVFFWADASGFFASIASWNPLLKEDANISSDLLNQSKHPPSNADEVAYEYVTQAIEESKSWDVLNSLDEANIFQSEKGYLIVKRKSNLTIGIYHGEYVDDGSAIDFAIQVAQEYPNIEQRNDIEVILESNDLSHKLLNGNVEKISIFNADLLNWEYTKPSSKQEEDEYDITGSAQDGSTRKEVEFKIDRNREKVITESSFSFE